MKKNALLLQLMMASLVFSCQKKPYVTFQPSHSENHSAITLKEELPPTALLETLKPPSLVASTKHSFSSGISEPVLMGINSPTQLAESKNNIFKSYKKAILTSKIARKLTEKKPKTENQYKGMGIAAMLLGIITLVTILISMVGYGTIFIGLFVAGFLGLFALIFGASSIGKLKGVRKIPSLIGILFGIVGLATGLILLIITIAFMAG